MGEQPALSFHTASVAGEGAVGANHAVTGQDDGYGIRTVREADRAHGRRPTDAARERAILAAKAPDSPARLSAELVAFVQRLRKLDLFKAPGVAETLDWARALIELDAVALDPEEVSNTLGVLLKYQDDIARIQGARTTELIEAVRTELRAAEAG